ncbi:MAG: helix-turn-helix transcriptional regulator [Actinomycetota bacterium]
MTEGIVGRESELAAVTRFLDDVPGGPSALIVEGEAGIGKTTLWGEGRAAALQRSYRVLACRPVEAETKFSFSALGDLLGEVVDEALPVLPDPQRRALEVALLLKDAGGSAPNRRAVSLAILGVFRFMARAGPLVMAVDDVQWLDAPSARVLEFAVRRLEKEPVGFLAAVRGGDEHVDPLGLVRALPVDRVRSLRLGPLSLDELDSLLRSRLDAGFPRPILLKLHRSCGGNPFFAIEIARVLARGQTRLAPGEALPVPKTLREMVHERVANLAPDARDVALVVSGLSQPTHALVMAAVGRRGEAAAGLKKAVQAGVMEVQGDRIRFSHSLLASVVYTEASAEQRRELHGRLAGILTDPEERARHLALAAQVPDSHVASALDDAASRAWARGAPETAAELSEMARRLTPPDRPAEIRQRTMDAATAHFEAGDTSRARSLLEEALDAAPPGPARADVFRQLGMIRAAEESWQPAAVLFGLALAEAGDDPALRASIEQDLGYAGLFNGDLAGAEAHARAALDLAEGLGDSAVLAESLGALGFLEFVQGRGIRLDIMERAVELEKETEEWHLVLRPTFCLAQLLKYSGELDAARTRFRALLDHALERGQENPVPVLLYHLAELECWAGDWDAASRYAEECLAPARQTGMAFYQTMVHYAKALVDAHLGHVGSARAAAEQGFTLAERTGVVLTTILNLSALGFLELSLGDAAKAHDHLGPAVGLRRSMGVGEPAYLRLLPDEIEALIALGKLDEASSLLKPFEERAKTLDRVWALATTGRCRGLLAAAQGDIPGALVALGQALHEHERLAQPFELARTLLVLGQVQRRDKKKQAARTSLAHAREIFDGLGAALWSEKARAELGRIGGRAPAPLALTPTEERVADLVAGGLSNREVADALFMSVNTVQANLKRIFRKLGIRSRTELARKIAPVSERPGHTSEVPRPQ